MEVTAIVGARGRVVVLATAIVAATATSHSDAGRLLRRTDAPARTFSRFAAEVVTTSDRSSIGSAPSEVVPASDRPVVSGGGKRTEGQRAPSLAPGGVRASLASIRLAWDVPSHGSVRTARPLALGLTRRGPPVSSTR